MVVRYIVTRVVVILESDKSCLRAGTVEPRGGGGGVLPYITYRGMCRPTGS